MSSATIPTTMASSPISHACRVLARTSAIPSRLARSAPVLTRALRRCVWRQGQGWLVAGGSGVIGRSPCRGQELLRSSVRTSTPLEAPYQRRSLLTGFLVDDQHCLGALVEYGVADAAEQQ